MRGQRYAPAAPYPRERPVTHCTGGSVGLRAILSMSQAQFLSPRISMGSTKLQFADSKADTYSTFTHSLLSQYNTISFWNPRCVTRIWNYSTDYACSGVTSSHFKPSTLCSPWPNLIPSCTVPCDCFQSSTVLMVRYEQRGIQPAPVPSYCSKTRGHKIWVRLNSSKIVQKTRTQPSSLMIWDRLFQERNILSNSEL